MQRVGHTGRWRRCREWAESANLATKVRETHSGSLKTHRTQARARRTIACRFRTFARLKMSHGTLPDVDPDTRFGHFREKCPPRQHSGTGALRAGRASLVALGATSKLVVGPLRLPKIGSCRAGDPCPLMPSLAARYRALQRASGAAVEARTEPPRDSGSFLAARRAARRRLVNCPMLQEGGKLLWLMSNSAILCQ